MRSRRRAALSAAIAADALVLRRLRATCALAGRGGHLLRVGQDERVVELLKAPKVLDELALGRGHVKIPDAGVRAEALVLGGIDLIEFALDVRPVLLVGVPVVVGDLAPVLTGVRPDDLLRFTRGLLGGDVRGVRHFAPSLVDGLPSKYIF